MPGADSNETLTGAVKELNATVASLHQLLRDDYPKRTEIERRFVSRLETRKHVTRLVLVALFTVVTCYTLSTGVYAACFVGDENPGVCKLFPGYEERVNRREEIDRINKMNELRIRRLEEKLRLKPLQPVAPSSDEGN